MASGSTARLRESGPRRAGRLVPPPGAAGVYPATLPPDGAAGITRTDRLTGITSRTRGWLRRPVRSRPLCTCPTFEEVGHTCQAEYAAQTHDLGQERPRLPIAAMRPRGGPPEITSCRRLTYGSSSPEKFRLPARIRPAAQSTLDRTRHPNSVSPRGMTRSHSIATAGRIRSMTS